MLFRGITERLLSVNVLTLIAVAALIIGFTPSMSRAVTCEVPTTLAVDPSITGAIAAYPTGCDAGSDQNDDEAGLAAAIGVPVGDVTLIDRDNQDNAGDGTKILIDPQGATSGEWYVDIDGLSSFERLFLVMKDGDEKLPNPTPPPDFSSWAWFELDLGGNCTGFSPTLSGADLCGNWTMYDARNLSHMSLYGVEGTPGGGGGQTPVPEPSTLALLGSGFLFLNRLVRRVSNKD